MLPLPLMVEKPGEGSPFVLLITFFFHRGAAGFSERHSQEMLPGNCKTWQPLSLVPRISQIENLESARIAQTEIRAVPVDRQSGASSPPARPAEAPLDEARAAIRCWFRAAAAAAAAPALGYNRVDNSDMNRISSGEARGCANATAQQPTDAHLVS